MSGRSLFFLLAQPEDINEITKPLLEKRKSLDTVSTKGEKKPGAESNLPLSESSQEVTALAVGMVVPSNPQMEGNSKMH